VTSVTRPAIAHRLVRGHARQLARSAPQPLLRQSGPEADHNIGSSIICTRARARICPMGNLPAWRTVVDVRTLASPRIEYGLACEPEYRRLRYPLGGAPRPSGWAHALRAAAEARRASLCTWRSRRSLISKALRRDRPFSLPSSSASSRDGIPIGSIPATPARRTTALDPAQRLPGR
jgi:hypothetical protein